LLSRHVDLSEQQGVESNDFLTCFVYDSSKSITRKVTYPHENVILNGVYGGNPHYLVRIDADEKHPVMNLVIRQYRKTRDVTFSLQVYSTESFSFGPVSIGDGNFPVQRVQGAFNPSGGPSGRSTAFHVNPQYRVLVRGEGEGGGRERSVEFTLKTNPKLSVSLSLLEGGGRKDYISKADEIFSSGDYRAGVACMQGKLKVDTPYTLTVSTWNAGEKGAFLLKCAGKNVDIRELKKEGDLMKYNYRASGTWTMSTGVGCANFGNYTANPTVEFVPAKSGEIFGRMGVEGRARDTAINFTLFETQGQLPPHASSIGRDCDLVVSSNEGIYKNASGGITIGVTKVKKGTRYAVLLSTFDPTPNVTFRLELHSTVELKESRGTVKLERV
jgi:hypothetical protein